MFQEDRALVIQIAREIAKEEIALALAPYTAGSAPAEAPPLAEPPADVKEDESHG